MATICGTGSCTWVFTPTGWIVTATTCTAPCGCSAASFPAGAKLNPGGIPHDPVPHADFADEVNTKMLTNPALPPHFTGQIILDRKVLPAVGTAYLMPCVK